MLNFDLIHKSPKYSQHFNQNLGGKQRDGTLLISVKNLNHFSPFCTPRPCIQMHSIAVLNGKYMSSTATQYKIVHLSVWKDIVISILKSWIEFPYSVTPENFIFSQNISWFLLAVRHFALLVSLCFVGIEILATSGSARSKNEDEREVCIVAGVKHFEVSWPQRGVTYWNICTYRIFTVCRKVLYVIFMTEIHDCLEF